MDHTIPQLMIMDLNGSFSRACARHPQISTWGCISIRGGMISPRCSLLCRDLLFNGWNDFFSNLTDSLAIEKKRRNRKEEEERRLALRKQFSHNFSSSIFLGIQPLDPFYREERIRVLGGLHTFLHATSYGVSYISNAKNKVMREKEIKFLSHANLFLSAHMG